MEFDFDTFSDEQEKETAPVASQQEFDDPLFRQQSLEESLASLYKPPYSKPSHTPAPEPVQPKFEEETPSFSEEQNSLLSAYKEEKIDLGEQTSETTDKKGEFLPQLLLSVGGVLLTLGLLLFFFSDNGVLTLQWNAKKWFIYCLFSLPMIYFGLRKLQPQDSSSGPTN